MKQIKVFLKCDVTEFCQYDDIKHESKPYS